MTILIDIGDVTRIAGALCALQIALGVVLGVWVLQLVLVAASPRLTHIAAVAGTAFRGRPGPRLSRFRPDFSADGTARSKDAAAAADQEEGGEPYDSTTLPLTPNKSHLDLSSLQHLNLELQHGTSAPYSGVRQGPFGFQPVSAAALASAGPPATCVDCLSAACFPACAPRATPAPGPGTPQPAQLGLKRLRWWCGGRGAPVSLAGAVAALPAAAQRLLLWVAVAAQVVAAGLLVDATEPPAERLALSQGVAISRWVGGGCSGAQCIVPRVDASEMPLHRPASQQCHKCRIPTLTTPEHELCHDASPAPHTPVPVPLCCTPHPGA